MKRKRRVLIAMLLIALLYYSGRYAFHQMAGASRYEPETMAEQLSPAADSLIKAAFIDLDPDNMVDRHVHIAGSGSSGSGCYVNEKMQSLMHPVQFFKLKAYLHAARVRHTNIADEEYMERLLNLTKHTKGKYFILAFDQYYNPDGSINAELTQFYIPNEYVYSLSKQDSDVFVPCISVHPYRKDATVELEKWAQKGVRMVKWLPNSMGIDPSDSKCDAFYDIMKQHDMVLLTHAGHERAVDAGDEQHFGNPLLLRKPLNKGVKVVMAHCAGLGENMDFDSEDSTLIDNFELFLRLMDDPQYDSLLFGDISAVTQYNRMGKPLETLLEREDLHPRLINGSDYPLPAINILIRTKNLQEAGYVTAKERELLNEIYDYNPLLFDLVLKRCLKHPSSQKKFISEIFMTNEMLDI